MPAPAFGPTLRPLGPYAGLTCRPVLLNGSHVRVGTTSWADRSLVREGGFYPKKTMTARARLAYYCERFPLAEVATTYRFPPTPEQSAQWAERTPDGFTLDIRAWSLLSAGPTLPDSLWPDLHPALTARGRDARKLYANHLQAGALDECWQRFAHALRPLGEAGRLGVVTLQYPGWWGPRDETWAELASLPSRLPGYRLAVELQNAKWLEGPGAEETLAWLEDHGLGLVCVDGPASGQRSLPAMVATTSETAVVRFRGRRAVEGEPWTWPYRYSPEELDAWMPALRDLASSAPEVHVLLDNCWRGDAVDNAATLQELLAGG